MTIIRWILVFVIALATIVLSGPAQPVLHTPDTSKPLTDRWAWALTQAKTKGFGKDYWIGYSIDRLMGERSYIGSFYSDRRRNTPTLGELLTGMKSDDRMDDRSTHGFSSMDGKPCVERSTIRSSDFIPERSSPSVGVLRRLSE